MVSERLPTDMFLRVQKSFVVNLNKITSIKRNRIFISKHSIPFSDTIKDELFRQIDPRKWKKSDFKKLLEYLDFKRLNELIQFGNEIKDLEARIP
ncbi:LytTR family transcriptional regulator DNA-binding domain-containing protein [Parapedobacter sp. GCM10030251]|uniref:LytTR family transcriptional regulator DNA-binding domain-containing protein n=1 Tax=Parapedobacter sp. GCM10030251 TaxID=3273419 RepID=UPI003608C84C